MSPPEIPGGDVVRGEQFEVALPERLNLGSYFLDLNLELGRGGRTAIHYEEGTYSFLELWRLTNRVGNVLRTLGVGPGNRVLLILEDSPEWVAAWLAAMKVGAVGTHAYTYLHPQDYAYLLDLVRPKVVIASRATLPKVRQAAQGLRFPKALLVAGHKIPALRKGEYGLAELLASAGDSLEVEPTHRDDIAFWNFSGGTTGKPKGVPHMHHDSVTSFESFDHFLGYSADDIVLRVPKLFFHYARDNGMLFALRSGAAVVLSREKSTAPLVFELIRKYRPTVLLNVPTMMRAMLQTPEGERADLGCVRRNFSSGEVLSPQLHDEWVKAFGTEVIDRLGSAESGMGYLCNRPGAVVPGSSGTVTPLAEIKLIDGDGREVPRGETGVLMTRSEASGGYYERDHEKSLATFPGGEWINTGDLFIQDDRDLFWYVGRANDMVKVSGVWVSPLEIEHCLHEYPGVRECAVLGVKNADGLTTIQAFVVPENGAGALERKLEDLKAHCKAKLGPQKFPGSIRLMDELPKTGQGKIDRRALQDEAAPGGNGSRSGGEKQMKHDVHMRVNGEFRQLAVPSSRTLLDVLVEDFRLARTKEGCSVGECGACTVSMDGKLVSACLVLAVDADRKEIVTMEKLTAGEPGFHPLMEAFIHPDEGARRTSYASRGSKSRTQVPTFCHLCPAHCSMNAIIEDGKVVDLEPEMESGLNAEQCAVNKGRFTIPEVLGHNDRLLYPQKRSGAKGEGKWQRISWDEALDTIAGKFNDLKSRFGPESVAFGLGEPKGLEFAFAQRLATAFGTPSVVTPGWCCGIPKGMAAAYTYGAGAVCDDSSTPALIVTWGVNMAHTTGGLRRETLERTLEAGGKLIAVDPQKTYVARLADLWIRVRPGADGALAAGLLKVIVEEKLYDREIVDRWTIGFDKLREHVASFSLEEVERLSWVPREQVVEFARLYSGTKPAAMHIGNAVEQHQNSFQTARAAAIMRAICGNLNIPGGDVYLTPPPYTRPGNFFLLNKYRRGAEKILGEKFKFAQRSAFIPPHAITRAILEEDPYPVKAAMFILSNPLVSYPNSEETYRALMKLEFSVVSELFMTPTAALADIVLPAAWGMEHDELGYWPGWHEEIRSYPKLADPPGECWPDTKIINELAKRLGLAEDFWEDDEEALDAMLKPSGMRYEEFKGKRVMKPTREYRRHYYPTPSGKIEIYSERLEKLGYEGMPLWRELSRVKDLPEGYPLLLTNGKEEAYMMSGFKHVASMRLVRPEPLVELHPETARKYGLEEGKWVYIESEIGRVKQKLSLNPNIDPRVVMAAFGWWFPERDEPGYGWRESNLNMLVPNGPDYDPSTGGMTLRGIPCRVCRA